MFANEPDDILINYDDLNNAASDRADEAVILAGNEPNASYFLTARAGAMIDF